MKRTQAIGIALALLLVPLVSAAGNNTTGLTAAADYAQCNANMVVSIINSFDTNIPGAAATLDTYKTTLPADATQLQTLAAAGDTTGFKTYQQGTFQPDVKAAHTAMTAALKTLPRGRNATNETRSALSTLRSDEQAARQTYQTCRFTAAQQFGSERIQAFNTQITTFQATADQLKAKSIDTSSLDAILSGAQTEIVTPLQDAINAATDGKSLAAAMQDYCLFDGCQNGTNYHLAAKFETERLHLLLGYFTGKWNLTSDQVATVQSKLDAATAALNAIDPHKYTDEARADVWDNIKAAAQALKQLQPLQHAKEVKPK